LIAAEDGFLELLDPTRKKYHLTPNFFGFLGVLALVLRSEAGALKGMQQFVLLHREVRPLI
jgi:hypothetical protein